MTLQFYKIPYFKRYVVFRKIITNKEPNLQTLGDIDLENKKWKFDRIDHKAIGLRVNITAKEKEQIKRKVNGLNRNRETRKR